MRRALTTMMVLLMLGLTFQFVSCASSKPKPQEGTEQTSEDDYKEIEKLLGITREESEQPQAEDTEEKDDLLKLLEADEGKTQQRKKTDGSGSVEDKRLVRLQKEINRLKKQLKQKNIQIAELKAQVALKNEKLRQYESGGRSVQSLSSTLAGTQVAGDYERKYQQALSLFNNRRYREALRLFEELVATDTRHSLSDNAQYWIGECYFALGDYRAAILAFEKVFTFKQSNKNDYAQYKLGLSYFKLGDKKRARQEFQNLIDNYPNSPLVEKARKYLMQL